jgi:membrane-associated phospholipid phosphatase
MAAGFSLVLLLFFAVTRAFRAFDFGLLDLIFILLPVGILGLKSLLHLLLSPGADDQLSTREFLAAYFRPFLGILRDWFPFLLLCACYYSLYSNFILQVNPHLADATLAQIDLHLLGHQPSLLLERFIHPWLTDFLAGVYFSHVFFFPGVALYFYLRGEQTKFRRIMMGFLTIMIMGTISYILVPAEGPGSYFARQYTRQLNGDLLVKSVGYIIQTGRVSFDCFPSLHVGIPLLLSFYLRDYCRKAFVPALLYIACMCLATVYLRYHYLADVLAAFAYAPAAYFLNDFLLRHWPGEKQSGLAAEIENRRPSRHGPGTAPDRPRPAE